VGAAVEVPLGGVQVQAFVAAWAVRLNAANMPTASTPQLTVAAAATLHLRIGQSLRV
jgi:hypothetical protein